MDIWGILALCYVVAGLICAAVVYDAATGGLDRHAEREGGEARTAAEMLARLRNGPPHVRFSFASALAVVCLLATLLWPPFAAWLGWQQARSIRARLRDRKG